MTKQQIKQSVTKTSKNINIHNFLDTQSTTLNLNSPSPGITELAGSALILTQSVLKWEEINRR